MSREIQLRSPNWLFGQRKYEESGSAPKVASQEIANGGSQDDRGVDGLCDLNWLSSATDSNEEDIFQGYSSKNILFSITETSLFVLSFQELLQHDQRYVLFAHFMVKKLRNFNSGALHGLDL